MFNGLSSVVAASRANLNSLSYCLYNFCGVMYSMYLPLNRAALVAIMLVMLVLIAVAFAAALVVDGNPRVIGRIQNSGKKPQSCNKD